MIESPIADVLDQIAIIMFYLAYDCDDTTLKGLMQLNADRLSDLAETYRGRKALKRALAQDWADCVVFQLKLYAVSLVKFAEGMPEVGIAPCHSRVGEFGREMWDLADQLGEYSCRFEALMAPANQA